MKMASKAVADLVLLALSCAWCFMGAEAKWVPSFPHHEDVPEECKDMTYCTNPPKRYPVEDMKAFVDKFKLKTYDLKDTSGLLKSNHTYPGEDDCPTASGYVQLYLVRESVQTSWQYVLQTPKFQQWIWYEKCLSPGSECFKKAAIHPSKIATCHQEFHEVSVQIYSKLPTKRFMAVRPFKCCSCRIIDRVLEDNSV